MSVRVVMGRHGMSYRHGDMDRLWNRYVLDHRVRLRYRVRLWHGMRNRHRHGPIHGYRDMPVYMDGVGSVDQDGVRLGHVHRVGLRDGHGPVYRDGVRRWDGHGDMLGDGGVRVRVSVRVAVVRRGGVSRVRHRVRWLRVRREVMCRVDGRRCWEGGVR